MHKLNLIPVYKRRTSAHREQRLTCIITYI